MAEIASPGSDPHSLRRHYPHQVQGVRPTFAPIISAIAAPPHFFLVQNKTQMCEVNKRTNRRSETAATARINGRDAVPRRPLHSHCAAREKVQAAEPQ
jgi:hypothetical protein